MKKIYKTPAVNVTSVGIKTIIMQGSNPIPTTGSTASTQGTGEDEEYDTAIKSRNMTDDSWNALW